MNWFNNLALTYDRLSEIVGIPDEKGNVLLPSNHMSAKSDICVTINNEGKFLRAESGLAVIVIPCTEESASRVGSTPNPHPLHEQLGYLALDGGKLAAYLKQSEKFGTYHEKVMAVSKYIRGGTLIDDLIRSNIKKTDDQRQFVRFSVEIPGDFVPNLWEDLSVFDAWQRYLAENENGAYEICYVTGSEDLVVTKHPKGVNPAANGAKLISGEDSVNYKYRGRFSLPEQANAIGAKASGKAHAMLKYLIATQGYKCDTQAIVAWAVDTGEAALSPFSSSYELCNDSEKSEADDLYNDDEVVKTDQDIRIASRGKLATDYALRLRNAYSGIGNAKKLRETARQIAIIAVDAATTGRMSVTFYQDMKENDYIERVINWHMSCRWRFGWGEKEYVSAPSTDKIIASVYGEPKGEGYNKIKKQARERILHNIICGERINRSWVMAAVNRVSNPFSYDKKDGGWDKPTWENALSVTCAIIRKYFIEIKEDIKLELELDCRDRDYLYGRLLAIAEKIESHARYLQTGRDDTDKRPVNAVRYMSAFASKPFRTWTLIYSQLNPYIQRLNGAEWYQRQIDEIMALFEKGEFESDKQLNGKYLMGYSLQRRALNNKNNTEESKNESVEKN